MPVIRSVRTVALKLAELLRQIPGATSEPESTSTEMVLHRTLTGLWKATGRVVERGRSVARAFARD